MRTTVTASPASSRWSSTAPQGGAVPSGRDSRATVLKTVTFHPSRIGCPSLPGTMKGMVHSIPGVHEVRVRYEDRSLDVSFDSTRTSEEQIIKKIGEEMGLALEAGEPAAAKEGAAAETCPM